MAWTLRALMGLSFGLGSLLLAGCDSGSDSGGETTSPAGPTSTGGGAKEGTKIEFTDGWVPLNDFGIQGSFYTFKDDMDSDGDTVIGTSLITPDSFAGTGTRICASGTAGKVLPGTDGAAAYDDYWGAAIGFNLSQVEGEDAALPYNATTHMVTGFAFTLSGDAPLPTGGELRFNVKVAGDSNNYCAEITSIGEVSFRLSQLKKSCWMPEEVTPDPANLEALHWQYVTNVNDSYDFNLCIDELRVLTD